VGLFGWIARRAKRPPADKWGRRWEGKLMIKQSEFFKKYGIKKSAFRATGLKWRDLVEIHDDYITKCSDLEPTANYIADCLRRVEAVHSLKIRLKDPEHLIEKIIRKRIGDNSRNINIENYTEEITDLIGIRALHLFKGDWAPIHDFIVEHWDLYESPTAYIRQGDPESFITRFQERGCNLDEHRFGYRSVHYLVTTTPSREQHIAEIQVRTIFEEGWSEIDHRVRYPYEVDNPTLGHFLAVFNRMAGSADEMGTFVRLLKGVLEQQARNAVKLAEEKEELLTEVKRQIRQLEVDKKKISALEEQIDELSKLETSSNRVVIGDPQIAGFYSDTIVDSYAGPHMPTDTIYRTGEHVAFDPTASPAWIAYKNVCERCGKEYLEDFERGGMIWVGPKLCPDCRKKSIGSAFDTVR
jgi:putative GTP pyrophosphokinase